MSTTHRFPNIPVQPSPVKITQPEATSAAQAWTACVEALRKRDEHMIHGWKEDIDTLLVFVRLPVGGPCCQLEIKPTHNISGGIVFCSNYSIHHRGL